MKKLCYMDDKSGYTSPEDLMIGTCAVLTAVGGATAAAGYLTGSKGLLGAGAVIGGAGLAAPFAYAMSKV